MYRQHTKGWRTAQIYIAQSIFAAHDLERMAYKKSMFLLRVVRQVLVLQLVDQLKIFLFPLAALAVYRAAWSTAYNVNVKIIVFRHFALFTYVEYAITQVKLVPFPVSFQNILETAHPLIGDA